MWKTLAQAFTTLVLAPIAIAGYQVQVSKVTEFATSFHRVAILPATGPDGIDPLWIEQLLFQKLAARQVPVVGSAQVRQALFDLGATSPAPEHLKLLASKLRVDAFVEATVGSAGRNTYGAVATAIYGTSSVIATPIETNRGAVQLTIIAADNGKMLMHGVASGESAWRTLKGVLGSMFDQMLDRVLTPAFNEAHTVDLVNKWIAALPADN